MCFLKKKKKKSGTSLVLQWLRFHASNAGGPGSIPGQGIRIPHAMGHGQKEEKEKNYTESKKPDTKGQKLI